MCANHKAVNRANANRPNLDATGIGACACARHGCFVPHSVVDFQKGERYVVCDGYMACQSNMFFRQMNIDYSICQALQYNTAGLVEALVDYDVGCSWIVNFFERLSSSRFLSLPEGLEIIAAIGKFHLAAHKCDCFVKFSLNFVHGAGQQDGEILETLWSSLNKIAGSTRAMTKSHRQEMLDDHIRDSNWKKLVHMGA